MKKRHGRGPVQLSEAERELRRMIRTGIDQPYYNPPPVVKRLPTLLPKRNNGQKK